jgi:putative ABC transport system permease protein
MHNFLQDIRYGLRLLWKSPSFTLVAVISIALGIGATTVIFSAVNGVLLRPLRYQEPERLVAIWGSLKAFDLDKNWISEPELTDFKLDLHSYSDIGAFAAGGGLNMSSQSGGAPLRVTASAATANFFHILGIQPQMGRAFAPGEDQKGRDNVVLLSYSLWKNRFASDPKILGQTITLDSKPNTVIGVLPPGFQFGKKKADVWVPIGFDPAKPGNRGSHYLRVVARLANGVTLQQANSELESEVTRMVKTYPNNYADHGFGLTAFSLKSDLVQDARTPLLVLLGAVGCLLLIATANVANLLLSRAAQREKEMGIRAALGASRMRIVRQLLTEGITLAAIGCAVGVAVAYWGVAALIRLSTSVPRADEIQLDGTVLLFSVVVSIVAGVLFALAPALHLAKGDTHDALKEGGRSNTGGKTHQRTRNGLAAAEVGLALVLLVGAGLLIRSFYRMLDVEPGFKTSHLLTFRVSLPADKYKDNQPSEFYNRLMERISAMPGVESTGAVSELPLSGTYSSGSVFIENPMVTDLAKTTAPPLGSYFEADYRTITPGYFQTLGIHLLQGRDFTAADDAMAPKVAIVDPEFAARVWPGQNPLGRRVSINTVPN